MRAALPQLLARYPELDECLPAIDQTFGLLLATFESGGKLMLCGNGGSAADCEHVVGELMKGFLSTRPVPDDVRAELRHHFPNEAEYLADNLQGALPAISLVSQTALISAYANDVAFDMAYAQQVYGYGRSGDTLIAISTSGNSPSVVNAVRVARARKVATVAFTGASGGALAGLCDIAVRVPRDETLEIQELHLPIYHTLCTMLEEALFPVEEPQ